MYYLLKTILNNFNHAVATITAIIEVLLTADMGYISYLNCLKSDR